ncbi:MAG: hypothetical protein ACO2PN_23555 [Pyrobaculum sp.]|jgi:hypothetical protein
MVVVRIARPALVVGRDRGMKPVAYGSMARPTDEPTYPITVADVTGTGKYRLLIVGDGDASAQFKVYVDGGTTPVDVVSSDAPAVVEGEFDSSVRIVIEGSGLHATFTYEVWVENDYVTGVTLL